jgi:hypothetical protein
MELPEQSEDQNDIIAKLNDSNVSVSAIPGSGKTTTSLHIALAFPSVNILLLTYNTRLKLETRTKVKLLNIQNMEVHSFHSFCVKYYKHNCFTDYELLQVLKNNLRPKKSLAYDMVIVDECQDVSPTYYELICKIVSDNLGCPKICVLGDRYQSIFKFNNADERYLIHSDKVFAYNELGWQTGNLSVSYRLTHQMANFLNNCILGYNRINGCKNGDKVRYIVCDCFGNKYGMRGINRPLREVQYYLERYAPEDIFILAPSVKSSKTPVRVLANELSSKLHVPLFVQTNDDERIDEDIVRGKMVCSTFHSVKGLERPVVIVFGLDASYFKFYKKDADVNECPNEIYVALSRGIECLSILHHRGNQFIQFLDKDSLEQNTEYENKTGLSLERNRENMTLNVDVTALTRHLPTEVLSKATEFFTTEIVQPAGELIDIPVKTEQGELFENVSEITGTAVPSYYEYTRTGKMMIYNVIKKIKLLDYVIDDISTENLLELANEYCAYKTEYNYKLNQISDYSWLSKSNLDACVARLHECISEDAQFEIGVKDTEQSIMSRKVIGYIDCIDSSSVWEFKCVKKIDHEHFIQLAAYAYLWNNERIRLNIDRTFRYYLLNILTGEIWRLDATVSNLKRMVEYLIYAKYGSKFDVTDEVFLKRAARIRAKYDGNGVEGLDDIEDTKPSGKANKEHKVAKPRKEDMLDDLEDNMKIDDFFVSSKKKKGKKTKPLKKTTALKKTTVLKKKSSK